MALYAKIHLKKLPPPLPKRQLAKPAPVKQPVLLRRNAEHRTISRTVQVPTPIVKALLTQYRDWCQLISYEPKTYDRLMRDIAAAKRTTPVGLNLTRFQDQQVERLIEHYSTPASLTGAQYALGEPNFNAVAAWCIAKGAKHVSGAGLLQHYSGVRPSFSLVLVEALEKGIALYASENMLKAEALKVAQEGVRQ